MNYITIVSTCNLHPCAAKLKTWEVFPNVVHIETEGNTNQEAQLKAMRLISKLGALGAVTSQKTLLKEFVNS